MANEFKIKKGLIVTGASGGTVVDIQGSQGQLFSVTDDLSGSIFAVSDISGVPIFDVNSSGLSTFSDNVVIGSVDTVVTGLNIGEASPTIQLFDTTNDGKLLMYMQDSSAVIGTYSNHSLKLFSNSTLALSIDISQNATFAGTVTAPTFVGDLNGTINTATTGVTQTAGNNSTLIATTAYADAAAAAVPIGNYLPLSAGDSYPLTGNLVIEGNAKVLRLKRDANQSWIQYVGSNDDFIIRDETDGRSAFIAEGGGNVYFPGGNVGIGTTSPSAPLDVFGVRAGRDWALSNRAVIRLDSNGASYPSDILFGHTAAANQTSWTGVYWSLSSRGSSDAGKFHFYRGNGHDSPYNSEGVIMTFKPDLNVGIGTTNPGYKLDVSGDIRGFGSVKVNSAADGDPYLALYQNGTEKAYFQYVDSGDNLVLQSDGIFTFKTATAERVRITAGGRVGIGVTNPSAKLQVEDSANNIQMRVGSLTAGRSPIIRLQGKNSANTTNYYADIELDADGGKLIFNDPGTSGSSIGQNPMVLDSSGKVGIGTTDPSRPLHVIGQVAIANALDANSTGALLISCDGTSNKIYSRTVQNATGAHPIDFIQTSSTVMRIDSDGNVGIGISNPSAKLHIANEGEGEFAGANSSGAGGSHLILKDQGSTSRTLMSGPSIVFQTPANADGTNIWATSRVLGSPAAAGSARGTISLQVRDQYNPFNDGTSWNWRTALTAINTGNVGIGTTSPSAKLNVIGGSGDDIIAKFKTTGTGTGDYSEIHILNDNNDALKIGSIGSNYTNSSWAGMRYVYADSGDLGLKAVAGTGNVRIYAGGAGSERMRITSAGNVGIGTTSPGYKLDVSGDARFTGDITVGNTAGSQINMLRTSANYINATNNTGYLVFRTGGYDTALTLDASQNATFAGDLTVSGGDITLGGTGRIQGVDTVSASTDAVNKAYVDNAIAGTPQMVKFDRSGINSSTYTMLATVNGNRLASIIKMTMTGTSGNVVFACTFDITVNHHKDIHVKSSNGDYTEVTLRITSDDNEDFSIEAKHNGSTTTTAEVCIYPLANEIITPTTTDPGYTGAEYEHTATEGWRYGGEDNDVESSNVIVDGNIGIGTTSPGHKLEVYATGDSLSVGDNSNTQTYMRFANSRTLVGYGGANAVIQAGSGKGINFNVNNDSFNSGTAATITSTGNVGIGTTSPSAKLDVQGTQGQLFSVTDDLSGDIFSVADISGVPIMNVNSDGTSYLDGKVYINATASIPNRTEEFQVTGRQIITNTGTDGPSLDLGYNSSGSVRLQLGRGRTANGLAYMDFNGEVMPAGSYGFRIIRNSGANAVTKLDQVGTGNLQINAANGADTVFTNTKVGIGTTSPLAKLAVIGDVHVGDIYTPSDKSLKLRTQGGLFEITTYNTATVGTAIKYSWGTGGQGPLTINNAVGEVMRLDGGGNVGIGTASPVAPLHIAKATTTATDPLLKLERISPVVDYQDLNSSGYFYLKENFKNSSSTVIGSREVWQNPGGSGLYYNFDNGGAGGSQHRQKQNSFHWTINSNSEKLTLGTNGYLGVNDTSPDYQLDVNGSGRFTSTVTATNFILSSDERLKENVEKVCDNRVKADWKTFELKADKGQRRYGVIAQELEKTNPEFVREDVDGFKSVAYIDLLIAKIAELEARLEKLEK
jgi:hypothetical protein